jgi:hypothetical protein
MRDTVVPDRPSAPQAPSGSQGQLEKAEVSWIGAKAVP